MKLSPLVLGLALLLPSLPATAEVIGCVFQDQPCDANGDRFECTGYGWTEIQFCSPTDQSSLTAAPIPEKMTPLPCDPPCPSGQRCIPTWGSFSSCVDDRAQP